MEPIHLHFAYTPLDFHRAYRLYERRSRRNLREKVYAIVILLLALGSFYLYYYPIFQYGLQVGFEFHLTPFVLLFFSVVMWFDLAAVLGRWVGERKRRKEPPVVYDLTFDGSGAHYTTTTVDAKLAWTEFRTVYEDQHSFLLMLKSRKNEYWTIPKQYFASARDMDAFQRLLQTQIAPP